MISNDFRREHCGSLIFLFYLLCFIYFEIEEFIQKVNKLNDLFSIYLDSELAVLMAILIPENYT